MLYFAYGSNLLAARLRQRVPSAKAVATGFVEQHRLVFNKAGRDGSGKANIEPAPGQRVHGVVYQMTSNEQWMLDEAESLGVGYRHHWVQVRSSLSEQNIFTYQAISPVAALRPYRWYCDLILAGAAAHGLPSDYISALAAIPAAEDPDLGRCQLHQSILNMSPSA